MQTELHLASASWFAALFGIVLIDIVLAGDNAIAIALAARTLPARQRLAAIVLGAAMAVVLRIALTFAAGHMLNLSGLKLAGGGVLLWIAVKLLVDNADDVEGRGNAHSLWHAIWLITLADVSMSLDNVLAVAGASHGNLGLLVFGLGLSIPLVVFASNLLSRLIERFPLLVYVGAAFLGKVGGEMIMTDGLVVGVLHPATWVVYAVEVVLAVAVSVGPLALSRRGGE